MEDNELLSKYSQRPRSWFAIDKASLAGDKVIRPNCKRYAKDIGSDSNNKMSFSKDKPMIVKDNIVYAKDTKDMPLIVSDKY